MMGYRCGCAAFLQPASPAYRGPVNAGPLGEVVTLDHTFREVIAPSADVSQRSALPGSRAGPLVLSVPAGADRHCVREGEDLHGHNDCYVGSRATGSAAGSYFLTGQGCEGDAP
jgi:hypothetical protein